MARLRYTLVEAKEEATRRAMEFVAGRVDRDRLLHRQTHPLSSAARSRASKHPMVWWVSFAPIQQEGTVTDGGEVIVEVNLETNSVGYCEI